MASLSAEDALKYKKSAKARFQSAMAKGLEFDMWGQTMEACAEYHKLLTMIEYMVPSLALSQDESAIVTKYKTAIQHRVATLQQQDDLSTSQQQQQQQQFNAQNHQNVSLEDIKKVATVLDNLFVKPQSASSFPVQTETTYLPHDYIHHAASSSASGGAGAGGDGAQHHSTGSNGMGGGGGGNYGGDGTGDGGSGGSDDIGPGGEIIDESERKEYGNSPMKGAGAGAGAGAGGAGGDGSGGGGGISGVSTHISGAARSEAQGTLLSAPQLASGKTSISVYIDKIGLKDAPTYFEPRMTISVADEKGNIKGFQQDTPFSTKRDPTHVFFNQVVYIQASLEDMNTNKWVLVFEFKHRKEKKKMISTRCWTFMEPNEIVAASGGADGAVLELYAKPTDWARKKLTLFTEKKLYLHVRVKLVKN